MAYRIEYTATAVKVLRSLGRTLQRRLLTKIETLQDNPRPATAVKLTGHDAYRIRIGDYRVLCDRG